MKGAEFIPQDSDPRVNSCGTRLTRLAEVKRQFKMSWRLWRLVSYTDQKKI